MRRYIFGDPALLPRTKRVFPGTWVDLEDTTFPVEDSVFVQAGALVRRIPEWNSRESLVAFGATLEESIWQYIIKAQVGRSGYPIPRSLYVSAAAIEQLNKARRGHSFWEALTCVEARRWIEPQLRNWYHPHLRVLQVITSLHVGGAEKLCAQLARMPECVGVACWRKPQRVQLRAPNWDLSSIPLKDRSAALIALCASLHCDVVHTHLLPASVNQALEAHFPVMTTMHNMPTAWPKGYGEMQPGLLVGCSGLVTKHLPKGAKTAWNGVEIFSKKPRRRNRKKLRIISVANFRKQKRLYKLPAIVRALRKKKVDVSLTLLAHITTSEKESLREYRRFASEVKKLRLGKHITIKDTLHVRDELLRHDVFVSTSAYEGLSLSQLEALEAGLPVVATEVGGASEIARYGGDTSNYTTVSPRCRIETFASKILEASQKVGKGILPEQFSLSSMTKRYRMLNYRALLNNVEQLDEVWLMTNNFSMGGAQHSAKRLLKRWSRDTKVRAFTLEEVTKTKGSIELIDNNIPVHNVTGDSARERCISFLKHLTLGKPRAILFWNAMATEKMILADMVDIPLIDVSPGEMFFREMERNQDKLPPELPTRTPHQYGERLSACVVKYSREADEAARFLGVRPYVVPNGVDGIEPVKRDFSKQRIFGTAARIAPHKRLEDLIEASNLVSAPLLIAGKIEKGADEYADKLKAMSGPQIVWMGQVDVREFLPLLSVFVMISEPAGCPNASLEALHSGLPVIATDVGGANEQVRNRYNGYLVPPRDCSSLVRAMDAVLQADARSLEKMSEASLRMAQKFTIERMFERYSKIVKSVSGWSPRCKTSK